MAASASKLSNSEFPNLQRGLHPKGSDEQCAFGENEFSAFDVGSKRRGFGMLVIHCGGDDISYYIILAF